MEKKNNPESELRTAQQCVNMTQETRGHCSETREINPAIIWWNKMILQSVALKTAVFIPSTN